MNGFVNEEPQQVIPPLWWELHAATVWCEASARRDLATARGHLIRGWTEVSRAASTVQGGPVVQHLLSSASGTGMWTGLREAAGVAGMRTAATQVPDETGRKVSSQESVTSSVPRMGEEAGHRMECQL